MYSDASFAAESVNSRPTTGALLCLVGDKTFLPLNWICKKQGTTSHSSTEAEIIGLDTILRMEGIPALNLWSQIVDVLNGEFSVGGCKTSSTKRSAVEYADWVPPSMTPLRASTKLMFVQDNDAVLKMVIKARDPTMKHVARTHRIDLD